MASFMTHIPIQTAILHFPDICILCKVFKCRHVHHNILFFKFIINAPRTHVLSLALNLLYQKAHSLLFLKIPVYESIVVFNQIS